MASSQPNPITKPLSQQVFEDLNAQDINKKAQPPKLQQSAPLSSPAQIKTETKLPTTISQTLEQSQIDKQKNIIEDELLKEDSINLCAKCAKCLELEEKLLASQEDKEALQESLTQVTIELAELKRVEQRRREETVEKGEMNYMSQSLKQIIKSYQDQNIKTYKFITQALKIPEKSSPSTQKQVYKLVESVVTDFISNWHEFDRDLNQLLVISSPTGEASTAKEDKFVYNYYEISAKLERLKENVVELQKRLKD